MGGCWRVDSERRRLLPSEAKEEKRRQKGKKGSLYCPLCHELAWGSLEPPSYHPESVSLSIKSSRWPTWRMVNSITFLLQTFCLGLPLLPCCTYPINCQ